MKRGTKVGSFVGGKMRELPCDGFFFPEEIKELSFAVGGWGWEQMNKEQIGRIVGAV